MMVRQHSPGHPWRLSCAASVSIPEDMRAELHRVCERELGELFQAFRHAELLPSAMKFMAKPGNCSVGQGLFAESRSRPNTYFRSTNNMYVCYFLQSNPLDIGVRGAMIFADRTPSAH
jgi:hypothetical protein